MQLVRKSIAYVLIVGLLFVSFGCGTSKNTPISVSENKLSVTDCAGRQVNIPEDIERIACLGPESAHAVAMLGYADKIVAVPGGVQRDVLITSMYPQIKKATVPRTGGVINIEELMRCHPDIILIRSEILRDKGEIDKIESTGIPYLVYEYTSIAEQQKAVTILGQALGAEAEAETYNRFYSSCLQMVDKGIRQIPYENRTRIYHSLNEATRTDVKDTLPADWIARAGGINVSVENNLRLYDGNYFASLEQILLWNPQVIIVNEPGVDKYIINNPQLQPLQAVSQKQVFQLPIGISRWGHPSSLETPLAIIWTAKLLYPDIFSYVDMGAEMKRFYQDTFERNLTDDEISDILQGKGMRMPRSGGKINQ